MGGSGLKLLRGVDDVEESGIECRLDGVKRLEPEEREAGVRRLGCEVPSRCLVVVTAIESSLLRFFAAGRVSGLASLELASFSLLSSSSSLLVVVPSLSAASSSSCLTLKSWAGS